MRCFFLFEIFLGKFFIIFRNTILQLLKMENLLFNFFFFFQVLQLLNYRGNKTKIKFQFFISHLNEGFLKCFFSHFNLNYKQ